jgi:hypothetical protein
MCSVVLDNHLDVRLVYSIQTQLREAGGHKPGRDTAPAKIGDYREMIEVSTATVVPRHDAAHQTIVRPRDKTHARISLQVTIHGFAAI